MPASTSGRRLVAEVFFSQSVPSFDENVLGLARPTVARRDGILPTPPESSLKSRIATPLFVTAVARSFFPHTQTSQRH